MYELNWNIVARLLRGLALHNTERKSPPINSTADG
jgi:hypothetical protein